MNKLKTMSARIYQRLLFLVSNLMKFKEPKIISGPNSVLRIPDILKENNFNDVLIITDESIFSLGLINPLVEELKKQNIRCDVYHHVVANPTISNVEEGLSIFIKENFHSVIGFGGGSALDCAKLVAARASNLNKPIPKMKGVLHVGHKPVFMIAVPTTAGTGSETTVAAVVVDDATRYKYSVNDPKLIPPYAVLDPTLLIGLPKSVTSTTGMDALTHAIEAYIGSSNTKKTRKNALEATKLIVENLEKSYLNPSDLSYRNNMQLAAYKAGVAFTKAYVGYVHAIAHALGGKYNLPHGLANAVILPIVLEEYGHKINKSLAELGDYSGITYKSDKEEVKAKMVISYIKNLNKEMNIPTNFNQIIEDEDIPLMVEHAYNEAYPLYPSPKMFDKDELIELFKKVKGE